MRIIQALHWLRDPMDQGDGDEILEPRLNAMLHYPDVHRMIYLACVRYRTE